MAQLTANGVPVYRDSAGVLREIPGVINGGDTNVLPDLDTGGGIVPTNKATTFTYDASGNEATRTVTDGMASWVRTSTYQNGQLVSDSGWVRQ